MRERWREGGRERKRGRERWERKKGESEREEGREKDGEREVDGERGREREPGSRFVCMRVSCSVEKERHQASSEDASDVGRWRAILIARNAVIVLKRNLNCEAREFNFTKVKHLTFSVLKHNFHYYFPNLT